MLRPVRNDFGRLFADIAAANATDVQRRLLQQFRSISFRRHRVSRFQFMLEFRVVHGIALRSTLFQRAERIDVIVIAGISTRPFSSFIAASNGKVASRDSAAQFP